MKKLVKESLNESLSEDEVYEAIIDALQQPVYSAIWPNRLIPNLIAPGEEFENVKQYLLDLNDDEYYMTIDDVYKEVEFLTSPSGRNLLNRIKFSGPPYGGPS